MEVIIWLTTNCNVPKALTKFLTPVELKHPLHGLTVLFRRKAIAGRIQQRLNPITLISIIRLRESLR